MLLNALKKNYVANKDRNPLYIRNLLKETVQYYLLDFISQSVWQEKFIFKGGTCLRLFFDLPRLSEDLDFDVLNYEAFNIEAFIDGLKSYLIKKMQFPTFTIKLANNKRTMYLKLPILKDIGLTINRNESNFLFVRIDLTLAAGRKYKTELSIKSMYNFSLVIKRYSLSDLFSGKISAILTREALEGTLLKERSKGRDYFDLLWFLEKKITPNWEYIKELTGLKKIKVIQKLDEKVKKLKLTVLESDLIPFFEDSTFVKNFCKNYKVLFDGYKKFLK